MSRGSGVRELWISGLEGSIFRVPRANLGTAGAGVRGFEDSGFPGFAMKGRAQNGFRDSKFQGLRDFEFRVPRKMDSGFQGFKDSVLFRTARESLRISRKLAYLQVRGALPSFFTAPPPHVRLHENNLDVYLFYMYERRG